MFENDAERGIRAYFDFLRESDRECVPSFERMLLRSRERAETDRGKTTGRWLVPGIAAACILIVGIAFVLSRNRPDPYPQWLRMATVINWRSTTDFLLRSPIGTEGRIFQGIGNERSRIRQPGDIIRLSDKGGFLS